MTDIKQLIENALNVDAKNTINTIMEYAKLYCKNNVQTLIEKLTKLNYQFSIDNESIKINFDYLKFKISDLAKEKVKLEAHNNLTQIDFGSTVHTCDECINTIHRIVMLYASISELTCRDTNAYVYHSNDINGCATTNSSIMAGSNNITISITNDGKLTLGCNIKRHATAQDPNIKQSLENIAQFFESIK